MSSLTEAGVRSAEIEATVRAILHDWVDPSTEATERFFAHIADDFTGHGTGPGDYYADPEALRAMVLREHAGMTFPFTLAIPWITVRVPHPDVGIATGRLEVTVDMGDHAAVEAPRFTFVLARTGERWMLRHFHFSVPDMLQDEGGTMDDLLWSRTQELERLVEERTADLRAAQAQLVQQEKLASLGTLTAGIAHEIKNPLNFVSNFAALVRELAGELAEAADPAERAALVADLQSNAAKIETHSQRADAIVRAMMDHARPSSGGQRPTDLTALVGEYLTLCEHSLRSRDPDTTVTVVRDLAPDIGEVTVRPEDIARVIVNLVENAFDAVRARTAAAGPDYVPTVIVATRRTHTAVEVRVADNGLGISDEVKLRLFEPFVTTKPAGEGIGLGLSISHEIATQGHGGELSAESTPGQGATFVLTLPVR